MQVIFLNLPPHPGETRASSPLDPACRLELGLEAYRQGRLETARRWLERVSIDDPNDEAHFAYFAAAKLELSAMYEKVTFPLTF